MTLLLQVAKLSTHFLSQHDDLSTRPLSQRAGTASDRRNREVDLLRRIDGAMGERLDWQELGHKV